MKLLTNFASIVITGSLSIMIVTSCKPQEQKRDDAFDLVKKERMISPDSALLNVVIIQEPTDTDLLSKTEDIDEWTKFKLETEDKIRLNDNKIEELGNLKNTSASFRRKVKALEKENNELKIKIDKHMEEEKLKREQFKVSMNHNINEIGIEIKAINIKNKD